MHSVSVEDKKMTAKAVSSWRLLHSCNAGHNVNIIAERPSARHLNLQHALGQCIFVRHALLSITLLCPSLSFVRHAPLSVTLFCPSRSSTHPRKDGGGMTHVYMRSSSRVGWMGESTPDQTPGPTLLFTSILSIHFLYPMYHHPHTMLFTARGIMSAHSSYT